MKDMKFQFVGKHQLDLDKETQQYFIPRKEVKYLNG